MSDYPNSDEEFELQYGDELELLNQQENLDDEIVEVRANNPARKSLDYGEPSTSSQDLFPTQDTNNGDAANSSFEQYFQPISNENNEETQGISTSVCSNNQENGKKRTINELFDDMDELLFGIKKDNKRHKSMDKVEQQLAMIDTILEMRRVNRENTEITRKTNPTSRSQAGTSNSIGDFDLVGFLRDSYKDTWKEAQEILNKKLDQTPVETETDLEEPDESELWTEKYKPKKYLDLLSDEITNKNLLKWMKLWDKVVFERRPKLGSLNENKDGKPWNDFTRFLTLDEDGRPTFKVALLCGRPGVGKTTLAHIVAKHAGYNVVEVNASDDRNLEFFKRTLETATQMSSVMDKRPNCVVFDEIDGAPSASIEFLIKFISGTVTKGKKKHKKGTNSILKRPIICICNDPYVPALKNLRKTALIFNFPSTNRLHTRLMEVSRREGLKTDVGTMIALAENSNYDVRTCLGVLQFFARRKKPITIADVYKTSVGQKDMQKGLFTVWNDIFTIERPKTRFTDVQHIAEHERVEEYNMSAKSRMRKILYVVQNFGDYHRLAQGVFENYPEIQAKKSSLRGVCDALNWFCYTDKINKSIMEQQNFTLMSYLPYAFVNWHFQFASLVPSKIKYPSQSYEVRRKLETNLSIIKELEKDLEPKVKSTINSSNLILDTIPFLTRIITPKLRPVNFHLFSNNEKESLKLVVNIMIDYNLTYSQEKNLDGSHQFNLDPDLLSVVSFPGFPERFTLKIPSKQLINQEIEFEKIKRNRRNNDEVNENERAKKKVQVPFSIPNHLQKLNAVKTVEEPKKKNKKNFALKDFFVKKPVANGQIAGNPDTEVSTSSGKSSTKGKGTILFRYNEGYSNAVRSNVKMSYLM